VSDTVKINLDLSQPIAQVTALGKAIKDSMGAKNIGKDLSDEIKKNFSGLKQELENLSKMNIGPNSKPEEMQAYVNKYREVFEVQKQLVASVKDEIDKKLQLAGTNVTAIQHKLNLLEKNKSDLAFAERTLKVQKEITDALGKSKEAAAEKVRVAQENLATSEKELQRLKDPKAQEKQLLVVEKQKKALADAVKLQGDYNKALELQEATQTKITKLTAEISTSEKVLADLRKETGIKDLNAIAIAEKELKLQKDNLVVLEKKFKAIESANAAQKQAVTVVEQLGERMKRLVEYTVMAFAVSKMKQYFTEGLRFIEQLDKSLTEIATVTGRTRAEMWKMADEFNRMGRELGQTTNDIAKASVLFYRQGLSTTQVLSMVRASTISASIANTDAADASNRLTAALRGYNLEADQAMAVADKLAALAAKSASSFDELSYAMTKTAASAYVAGIDMDHLYAYLAKVIETTRYNIAA